MKRIIMLLSSVSLALTLIACGQPKTVPIIPEPTPDQERPSSESGLSLKIKENVFTDSPTQINTVITNDSARDYGYGEFYHIEHLVDAHWHMITYSDFVFTSDPTFKDSGYLLKSGEEAQQSFSVEQLGVTLFPGEYRLVKTFLVKGDSFHEISVAAPFTVK